MNKTQLIDALAARIGDRRTAVNAVDGLLSTIVETVQAGDSVSLTGFGVFEPRARAARVGRNPRTGETVAVPAATVPAFRPGTGFRAAVGGDALTAAAQSVQSPPSEVPPPAKPTKAKAAPKAKPAAKAAAKPAAVPEPKQASKAAAKSSKAPKSGKAAAATKSAGKSAKAATEAAKPKKKSKK
ncbi:MAG: DNA-binding protein HU-beta [Pseudonocardiales bacterium]|nr:DNA-binding protein HU-beta [Pseudonocardiales bacterium]